MAKVADCKFAWKKSPSTDVSRVEVILTANGVEQTTTLTSPDVEEFLVTIQASSSGTFVVKTYDTEGGIAVSQTLSWSLGDLEAPFPATDLTFTVLAVRDDGPPSPSAAPKKPKPPQ